jgi:hypothetical protein
MSDDKKGFEVNFSSGHRYDLDEIRRRKEAFMPDGEHAWVISTIFAVEDPEQAMDDMELGAENFIGVGDIHCLLCAARYTSDSRRHKCPQTLPGGQS